MTTLFPAKPKRKRKLLESSLQKQFLIWLGLQYPKIREHTLSIPNGGARTAQYGKRLKDEGLKKGAPDVFIAYPAHNMHGLFLEFKRDEKEEATQDQLEVMALLEVVGYKTCIVWNVDGAILATTSYLEGKPYDRPKAAKAIRNKDIATAQPLLSRRGRVTNRNNSD